MKTRPSLAFGLLLSLIPGAILAEAPPVDRDAYQAVIDGLSPYVATRRDDWTDQTVADFNAKRARLDGLLRSDPLGPAATEWFSDQATDSRGRHVAWLIYSPATYLQISLDDPLASDVAQHFNDYISMRFGLRQHDRAETACLSQKALLAQLPDTAEAQDLALANAVAVIGQYGSLTMRADNFARAALLAGADHEAVAADPDRMAADIQGQILYALMDDPQEFDPETQRNQVWIDFMAGEKYSGQMVDQAIDAIAATDLPQQIHLALPFFQHLREIGESENPDALGALCP